MLSAALSGPHPWASSTENQADHGFCKKLQEHWERVQAYKVECTEAGRECLTPREAARLFGVDASTIRVASHAGKVRPVFDLTYGRALPFYRLGDLVEYFADRATADLGLLATMRANGHTCYMQSVSPGGWLLLCERPGLRAPWDDESAS